MLSFTCERVIRNMLIVQAYRQTNLLRTVLSCSWPKQNCSLSAFPTNVRFEQRNMPALLTKFIVEWPQTQRGRSRNRKWQRTIDNSCFVAPAASRNRKHCYFLSWSRNDILLWRLLLSTAGHYHPLSGLYGSERQLLVTTFQPIAATYNLPLAAC